MASTPPSGDHAAQLIAAQKRIIEAGDMARRRLSRDLHDGAQQQFVTAVIRLQLAQERWSSDPERARQMLDAGVERAEAGLQTLRELVAGIHPAVLAHHGLGAAVDALAAAAPIPVALDLADERLPSGIEASLYFFVSEAVTNGVKHSAASQMRISIEVVGGDVVVDVRDNGIGGVEQAMWGSGLYGLADRVGALSGVLTISSPAGTGTTLHAVVPLQPPSLI
jgi:signal transduction histidine kinase